MYGYLLKSDRWRQKQYKAIINEEEKRVLWPEKWNYEKLMGIRDDYVKQFGPLGLLYFRQEYQNEAVALGGEEFKREWLLHYTEKPRFIKDLPRFMGVDPAMGLKPQASYTAIVTVAFGQDSGRFWVLDMFRGKYGYGDLPNIIASKANQWKPLLIGIESAFWQKQLATFFPPELRVVPFNYQKHGMSGKKEDRIRMLQPYFMARRIELPPAKEAMTDTFITQEYLPFPAGMTTDLLDALNIAIHLAPLKSQQFIKKWI
jgi:phage terminase large subunit-like protein